MIAKIDVSPAIRRFDEHLRINDRVIFSARFGDGKTSFLNEYMEARGDKYEFIVLYPVNYQIAPNEAVMEYIKRDILFQLLLKGYIKPDIVIPDEVMFQWYISSHQYNLFTDVMQFMTSLSIVDPKWGLAINTLFSISHLIEEQCKKFREFKGKVDKESDFNIVAQYLERFSNSKGGLYELDMISYLIIQTIQKIKDTGKQPVLIVEDLDRIDPAHLFRILNVFSAHIDRVNQCSNYVIADHQGNKVYTDTLNNKFGFDKVVMVLDYYTTKWIFSHFYGEQANYQGYIDKFISHNVFHYSVKEYALLQLSNHFSKKCNMPINLLFSHNKGIYRYISPEEISVRNIAQVLDTFEDSIIDAEVSLTGNLTFNSSTPLTRTIATMRRLGVSDEKTFKFLTTELDSLKLVDLIGGFLLEKVHVENGFNVFYDGKVIHFDIDALSGGRIAFRGSRYHTLMLPDQSKHLAVDINEAFKKACSFVK